MHDRRVMRVRARVPNEMPLIPSAASVSATTMAIGAAVPIGAGVTEDEGRGAGSEARTALSSGAGPVSPAPGAGYGAAIHAERSTPGRQIGVGGLGTDFVRHSYGRQALPEAYGVAEAFAAESGRLRMWRTARVGICVHGS